MISGQWDVTNERDECLKQTLLQIQSNLSTMANLGTEENSRSREVAVMGRLWCNMTPVFYIDSDTRFNSTVYELIACKSTNTPALID